MKKDDIYAGLRIKDRVKFDGAHYNHRWLYYVDAQSAVQCVFWAYPVDSAITKSLFTSPLSDYPVWASHVWMPTDIGYHVAQSKYPDLTSDELYMTDFDECDVLFEPCFYDGSGLAASSVLSRWMAFSNDDEVIYEALADWSSELNLDARVRSFESE